MKRFPFDTKNLWGYLEGIVAEALIIRCACFFSANFLSLGAGCFLFMISSVRDMKGTLRSINKKVKSTEAVTNRSHVLKRFTQFIKLHSETRQLSSKPIDWKEFFSNFPLTIFRLQSNIGIHCVLPTFGRIYSHMELHEHWRWNGANRNAISLVTQPIIHHSITIFLLTNFIDNLIIIIFSTNFSRWM